MTVHISFAALFLVCVMVFKFINDKSIIDIILKVAGYTYGPLLGLFSFGILTRRRLPPGADSAIHMSGSAYRLLFAQRIFCKMARRLPHWF